MYFVFIGVIVYSLIFVFKGIHAAFGGFNGDEAIRFIPPIRWFE